MPMSRYQIRNEYSLADPEVYRAADKDDPEALLEGVAMAGLVGVLRQLGDLAESVPFILLLFLCFISQIAFLPLILFLKLRMKVCDNLGIQVFSLEYEIFTKFKI